ncbi:MAG: redoxin family protein [Planctomycetes bacterium]|nr:redoxin family protein [Planctomycetota bacterium]
MTTSRMFLAVVMLSLGSALFAAPPETLKLSDIANRPDRLPETVVLNADFNFTGGASAKKGQTVQVLEFNGGEVVVNAGNDLVFGVSPAQCDLLDAANKVWAKLTPEQRAIEPATLLKDPSLWPEKAMCKNGFNLNGGVNLPPNGEYEVVAVLPEGVSLYSREHKAGLIADLVQTDLIARARQRVLLAPEARSSRIVNALKQTNMVTADGKPFEMTALDHGKVFALYFGASWCPPCRHFSPSFVKFVSSVAAANPNLVVVLMSNDEKDADMLKYMQDEKMPFPAVTLASLNTSPVLLTYVHGAIPQLAIVDRDGRLLSDCYDRGRYINPEKPLAALSKLLDTGAAK